MNVIRAINERTYASGASAAHRRVQSAVAHGDLPEPSTKECVDCGNPASVYDHRDYNKPLDVEAVCRRCNGVRGAAKPVSEIDEYEIEAESMPACAPKLVPLHLIQSCSSYREACLFAWNMRARRAMTRATLAELTGMRPSHIPDFISADAINANGAERREMPAKYIPAFERAVGNTYVSQWLAHQSGLVISGDVGALQSEAHATR